MKLTVDSKTLIGIVHENMNGRGNTFIAFKYRNEAPKNVLKGATDGSKGEDGKKLVNPFWGNVVKVSSVNAMIGSDYATRVNNQAKREGKEDRDVMKLPYGEWIGDSGIFILSKDKVQMRTYANRSSVPTVHYETLDGTVIPTEDLIPFFSKAKKGGTVTQQDLEDKIDPRNYILDKMTDIKMFGSVFNITTD